MNNIFEQMLSRYPIISDKDRQNAIYEVMQQITLAGLYRGGFFNKAAFYGGTCLRIFHKLDRFSEDMDFSLLTTDSSFKLENYFPSIIDEFKMLGREIVITKKTNVISIRWNLLFLKTIQKCMMLHFKPKKSEDKNRSRYTTSFEVSNRTKAVITSILFYDTLLYSS